MSQIPGRIRLHLRGWTGIGAEQIENRLRRINGVHSLQANPLTGNVLIQFDPLTTDADTLLANFNEMLGKLSNEESASAGYSPTHVVVRGLLGHAVVDSLWFGAGFLGSVIGLPLAGLGPLHVLLDIAVWTMALTGEHSVRPPRTS